jgi:hypothetical protein
VIAVVIENDDCFGAPWEECDGWEHSVERVNYDRYDDRKGARGYVPGNYGTGRMISVEIEDGIGYYGCSKQVRAELIAQVKRNTLDQLVEWYSEGWSWYVVRCEFNGYHASMGGIDTFDYAQQCCFDVADDIADQLEADGYTVENRRGFTKRNYLRNWIKQNMSLCVVSAR